MKTEREIYLKPLTLREQVAMEQGICAGSDVMTTPGSGVVVTKHDTGFDGTFDSESSNSDFEMPVPSTCSI